MSDHELLGRIGSGSYGEVWMARCVLGVLRAVKVVRQSRFEDHQPYEREFAGVLKLEPLTRAHKGLVDVLHVGRRDAEGYFYYVMELADDAVDGLRQAYPNPVRLPPTYRARSLGRELRRRGHLSLAECIQMGLTLSGALSLLHHHQLVHRDIKPSNILYVGGVPQLGDPGLGSSAGNTTNLVGTKGYIPPEGCGTPAADVYSLGKVLYEASTGLSQTQFPLLPSRLMNNGGAEFAEFNEVLLKACAPDSRQRYASAEALHNDLALLYRGQSIRQRRHQQRLKRWLQVLAAMGLLAAGVIIGLAWATLRLK